MSVFGRTLSAFIVLTLVIHRHSRMACILFSAVIMSKSPAIVAALLAAVATPAIADNDRPPEMPPPPPPQMYPAPLSQQTQPTYVPQSVAMSGPEEIDDVDDERAPPPGYTAVHRKRKGLLIGGGVTLGATYGVSALVAAVGSDTSDGGKNEVAAMWIPVAGPFVQMSRTDSATARVFLAGLGGAQVAGAIMLYYGLTSTRRVFVRNDLVGVTVVPFADRNSSGLALAGRF